MVPDAQNKVSFLAAAPGPYPFCSKGKLFSSYLKSAPVVAFAIMNWPRPIPAMVPWP